MVTAKIGDEVNGGTFATPPLRQKDGGQEKRRASLHISQRNRHGIIALKDSGHVVDLVDQLKTAMKEQVDVINNVPSFPLREQE